MRPVRYLITGGSGYIGGRLTDELSGREETEKIVDVDLRPPPRSWPQHEFVKADIRDRKQMRDLLERHEIDALLHFAFVLNPIRDEAKMYDIDVNGTQAVLQAAADAGVKQVIGHLLGGRLRRLPRQPEADRRGLAGARGARTSPTRRTRPTPTASASSGPWSTQIASMTIVRPCDRLRAERRQLLHPFLREQPFHPDSSTGSTRSSSSSTRTTSSSALIALLDGKHAGAFNLAGDGALTWRRAAELARQEDARNISLEDDEALQRRDVEAARPSHRGARRQPGTSSATRGSSPSKNSSRPRVGSPSTTRSRPFKITMRAQGHASQALSHDGPGTDRAVGVDVEGVRGLKSRSGPLLRCRSTGA